MHRVSTSLGFLVALFAMATVEVQGKIDFAKDVLPILSENCFTCHGPDAEARKADLRLDLEDEAKSTEIGAIVAGHPDGSELVARIFHEDSGDIMPPPKSNLQLSDDQKKILRDWIAEGASWGKHWSFVTPERPEAPGKKGLHPIDAFVRAQLAHENLQPAPEARPETLIRRVSLDLNGLPPTPSEVEAFVKDYAAQGEKAYSNLVDRLLASPRYGETMALPWLDAARFADTDGYQYDGPRQMWRWRDWVIEAYNRHLPFDQFTIEQIAGDLLPEATLDQHIATGFNRNHRYNSESGLVTEEFLLENAVDRVDTTSTLWMGLTMGCARCHDHKYDPISAKDYYQLISFFNNVPEGGRAVKAGNSEPWIVAPTVEQQKVLADHDAKVEAALRKFEEPSAQAAYQEWCEKVAAGSAKIDKGMISRGLQRTIDLDGPSKDLKVKEGTTQFGKGVFGQAAVLDGKTILDVGPAGNELRANQKWSTTFWMRADDLEHGVVLSRQNGRKGLAVEVVEGKIQFYLVTRWIAGVGITETLEPIEKGRWYHVAVVSDGTNRATEQAIYLDGKRVETRNLQNTNSNNGGVAKTAPVLIGGGNEGPNFKGAVDQIRFYDRNLSDSEVFLLSESVYASAIAKKGSEQRTEREEAKLRFWYLEHAEETGIHKQWTAAMAAREKYIASLPTTMVMEEMSPIKETRVRNRGVYNDYGEQVDRKVPAELPPMSDDQPRNRLGFAQWLVSGDHPLTARVAVNRYWQRYFGTGLVKTAEDFGIQGEYPSHPELLDWLATEFVRTGWDTAAMQKLIVTSKTYRQSSRMTPALLEKDPENRLLARGPRIRLPAHVIRDQALHASGLLVEKVGGPSVSPYQPANLWIEMSMGMKYRQSKGDDLYRRSLYTIWKRTVAPPSMAVFDSADREACWVRVKRTNTPLQALTLLNETGYVESARNLGLRIIQEGGDDPVGFGFKVVTSRLPTERERTILEAALTDYRDEFDAETAAQLLAVGESKPPKEIDPAELAAHTALANVLLNLDEVITRE